MKIFQKIIRKRPGCISNGGSSNQYMSSVQVENVKVDEGGGPDGTGVILATPITLHVPGGTHVVVKHNAGNIGAGTNTIGPREATPLQQMVN